MTIFLAHLSQRLTRWAYSIPMVRLPSVVVHTFKLEYLWSQLDNLDQILCVASLGWWGKGCIRFWGRLDQNSGFHGNRKPLLSYNGENDVSTFSRLFLSWSFLYPLQTSGGVYCFHVRPSFCPSMTFWFFLNILKRQRWKFIKICRHIDINKMYIYNRKLRARGQFCGSYCPL